MSDDYYAILGVARTSDQETIKAAYRKLAPTKHPDRNKRPNATADFQRVRSALIPSIQATANLRISS